MRKLFAVLLLVFCGGCAMVRVPFDGRGGGEEQKNLIKKERADNANN